jgi:hypothetical protein
MLLWIVKGRPGKGSEDLAGDVALETAEDLPLG